MMTIQHNQLPKVDDLEHTNSNIITTNYTRTDESVLTMWLSNKAKSTQNSYKSAIKLFYSIVAKGIREMVVEDLFMFCNYLAAKYPNKNTQKNKLQVVKSLLSFALKIGYTQFNVGLVVKAEKSTSTRNERIVASEDIKRLFLVANDKEKAILTLGYLCGLRASEIISVKPSDIANIEGKKVLKVLGKGSKERFIILGENIMQYLLPFLNQDYLVQNYKGGKISRVGIHKLLKKLAEKAGINENLSTHWLRHSHATHSLKNGCDLKLLSASLGHSSIAVTSVYLHTNPDDCSSNYLAV